MRTLADFFVEESVMHKFYYISICEIDVDTFTSFDTNALELCQLFNQISYEYGVRTSKIGITLDNCLPGMSIFWNFDDCERKRDYFRV